MKICYNYVIFMKKLTVLLGLLGLLLVVDVALSRQALAAADFSVYCKGVPGVTCASVEDSHRGVLKGIGTTLLRIATGLSVILIIWSGYLMVMSMGDEGKLTQARFSIVYALLGLFLALISQAFVAGVAGTTQLTTALSASRDIDKVFLGEIAELFVTVFNVLFIVFIFISGIRMLMARGRPDEFNKARHQVAWVIGGAIVLNLARVLVKVVISLPGVFG